MKLHPVILLAIAGLSLLLPSCQSRQQQQERPSGISAAETGGFDREKVYETQDRVFRQLAY